MNDNDKIANEYWEKKDSLIRKDLGWSDNHASFVMREFARVQYEKELKKHDNMVRYGIDLDCERIQERKSKKVII